jgi:asparagine synthase (glutamine-hydrolysing)
MSAIPFCYWLTDHMRQKIAKRHRQLFPKQQRLHRIGQQHLLDALYDAFSAQTLEFLERDGSQFNMEIRHPFYDRKLIQHAFSTPERFRLRGDTNKYIHVQALKEFMPKRILERKSKAEFSNVFRRQLDQMKVTLTETLPSRRDSWVSPVGMDQLYRCYQKNPHLGWPVWTLWSVYGCDCVFAQD